MKSPSKQFEKCVPPCLRFLTLEDTHNLCIQCLGEELNAPIVRSSQCQSSVPCPYSQVMQERHLCLAARALLLPRHDKGSSRGDHRLSWLRSLREVWLSVVDLSHLLDQDVLSLAIQPGRGGCGIRGRRCTYVYSQPAGPAYGELVDVMARATNRLYLAWKRKKREVNPGRLDERFQSVSVSSSELPF